MLRDIADALTSPAVRAVVQGALAGGDQDGDVAAARDAFWAERFGRSGAVVHRAVDRGEVPVGTDPRALLEMAASPIYFRILFTAEPVGAEDITVIVRRAVRAFTPGD